VLTKQLTFLSASSTEEDTDGSVPPDIDRVLSPRPRIQAGKIAVKLSHDRAARQNEKMTKAKDTGGKDSGKAQS